MTKNIFAAAFVAATLISTAQAAAMVEQTDTVNLDHRGVCKVVESSDVADATIFGKSNVSVSIKLEANYTNGQKRDIAGTPVFVFANSEEAFKADQYQILKGAKGKFAAPQAGFFRVIPKEIQTVEYPQGVQSYNVVQIKICAQ